MNKKKSKPQKRADLFRTFIEYCDVGSDSELYGEPVEYSFHTKAELDAFILGIGEAMGATGYEWINWKSLEEYKLARLNEKLKMDDD